MMETKAHPFTHNYPRRQQQWGCCCCCDYRRRRHCHDWCWKQSCMTSDETCNHHISESNSAREICPFSCDYHHDIVLICCDCRKDPKDRLSRSDISSIPEQGYVVIVRLALSFYLYILSILCLNRKLGLSPKASADARSLGQAVVLTFLLCSVGRANAYPNDLDKTVKFLDKVNLEQSIAAVFNKVAYGSTTKRSIPDNAYPVTTLATPLLTTYRYSDGNDEWLRVDVRKNEPDNESEGADMDFERSNEQERRRSDDDGYGLDLERDHVLPTSAPAADILKNNNNKHYSNPNRFSNDRLKPNYETSRNGNEQATENVFKTTTTTTHFNGVRNMRPTKSMYSKDVPSYVPPSRAFFTPPLPPEYLNPFADKPTLRGTNSDSFVNRRPIPPPSLMPNKDRIPFRPDLPPSKTGVGGDRNSTYDGHHHQQHQHQSDSKSERKKTLNTPSQQASLDKMGDMYGLGRSQQQNDSAFEYEKAYIPSITRILSGSNGRHDDIPDVLLRTVTANPQSALKTEHNRPRTAAERDKSPNFNPKMQGSKSSALEESVPPAPAPAVAQEPKAAQEQEREQPRPPPEVRKGAAESSVTETTTALQTNTADSVNMANVGKQTNATTKTAKASSDEIWLVCWNVHVYLVVFLYIVLAVFSIYKLIRYENDPHMFSKSYFLTIHLMLTVICVLRIFYLTYDPYNVARSLDTFLYDFLHNFPLSLLATTFAVLILFLLKRTLNHLKMKTRPVFLVAFGIMHIVLCLCVSVSESLGHFHRGGLIVCKPVFVLLAWALGISYLYLYKIIKNVLAKKAQNLSEMCTQNISYASHITIAVALLFLLLGFVQLYALFFIKVDRFGGEVKHHWILWGFELSVRLLELSIITLLAIVVSLKMSQREKQTVGFPLFPCTTSDSSTDNIFPNNCTTNPNALNYSRNEMALDSGVTAPSDTTTIIDRSSLPPKAAFHNDSFDKKSTLERYNNSADSDRSSNFDRFERPKWGGPERLEASARINPIDTSNFVHYERSSSGRRVAAYVPKNKYDMEYNNDDYQHDVSAAEHDNVYSQPVDNNQYERTRHDFERADFDRRSRSSTCNTSGRRSTGRTRKNQARPHLGVQTLPGGHDVSRQQIAAETMLVDEQGFVRFRHIQDMEQMERPKKVRKQSERDLMNHYSDA